MTDDTITIRRASAADAAVLVQFRHDMFAEMGFATPAQLERMRARMLDWLPAQIDAGRYRAWLAVTGTGDIAAAAAVWLYDAPPHPVDAQTQRAHVLDVYTCPAYRRQGLARRLMTVIIDWCRAEGYAAITLRASDGGRPLYERLGFTTTSEMQLRLSE